MSKIEDFYHFVYALYLADKTDFSRVVNPVRDVGGSRVVAARRRDNAVLLNRNLFCIVVSSESVASSSPLHRW